ncbi:hypothetical protein [Neptunicella sp.]|uniref:hypothetical protein n=1 Tax=Neptunicella sp. TaxID=2125986 RepID=UPI003F68FE76
MSHLEADFSTPEIDDNFQQIKTLLKDEVLKHTELFELVTVRDKLILDQLDKLNPEQKQLFSQSELVNNEWLQSHISSLFDQTEDQLSKLMRHRKAIKKYK